MNKQTQIKFEEFRSALKNVDWHYRYSEGRDYYRGREKMERAVRIRGELMAIQEARFDAVRIWNEAAPEGERIV